MATWTAVVIGLVGYYVATGNGDVLLVALAVFCLLGVWLLGLMS